MDRRITEFIAGLRAAGIRVSLAETTDAMRAIEQAGITERNLFALALQASLIKDAKDQATFRELFPLYFGQNAPPPMQQPGGGQLSDDLVSPNGDGGGVAGNEDAHAHARTVAIRFSRRAPESLASGRSSTSAAGPLAHRPRQ